MAQWALAIPQGRGLSGNHHAHALGHSRIHLPAVGLKLGVAWVLGVELLAALGSAGKDLDGLGHAIPALDQVDRQAPAAVLDFRSANVGRTVAELMPQAVVAHHVGRSGQSLAQVPDIIAIGRAMLVIRDTGLLHQVLARIGQQGNRIVEVGLLAPEHVARVFQVEGTAARVPVHIAPVLRARIDHRRAWVGVDAFLKPAQATNHHLLVGLGFVPLRQIGIADVLENLALDFCALLVGFFARQNGFIHPHALLHA